MSLVIVTNENELIAVEEEQIVKVFQLYYLQELKKRLLELKENGDVPPIDENDYINCDAMNGADQDAYNGVKEDFRSQYDQNTIRQIFAQLDAEAYEGIDWDALKSEVRAA